MVDDVGGPHRRAEASETLLAARRGSPTPTAVPSGVTPTWTVRPPTAVHDRVRDAGGPPTTPTVPASGWGAGAAGAGAVGSAPARRQLLWSADAVTRLERLAVPSARGPERRGYERAKKAVLEGKAGW